MAEGVDTVAIDERDGSGRGKIEIAVEKYSADGVTGVELLLGSRGRLPST